MIRRIAGIAVAVLLIGAAYGCGGSSGPSVSSGARRDVHPAADDHGGNPDGTQTVEYQGLTFDVPGNWKVVDLTQDPTACVRFDVHAVYLGTPGPDMNCPAQVIGRTDALLVQPAGVSSLGDSGAAVTTQDVNGVTVAVADSSTTDGELDATANGVAFTFVVGEGSTAAEKILQSVRPAGTAATAATAAPTAPTTTTVPTTTTTTAPLPTTTTTTAPASTTVGS